MPTAARNLIKFRTGGGSGGSGGSTGNFGYAVITPSGGSPPPAIAQIDISDGGSPPTTRFIFRLGLSAIPVMFPAPIWTGGTISAGLKIWLFIDQDATGNRATPTFATGSSGDFSTDVAGQQIDGTGSTRSCYALTYHGTRWTLDTENISTGMSLT